MLLSKERNRSLQNHSPHASSQFPPGTCFCRLLQVLVFPVTAVLWNRLAAELAVLDDLDSFKRGEVGKISYRTVRVGGGGGLGGKLFQNHEVVHQKLSLHLKV